MLHIESLKMNRHKVTKVHFVNISTVNESEIGDILK